MKTRSQPKGLYHPYLFAGWYYLVRGTSSVVYIDADTGEVIASKDKRGIQLIADRLNQEERARREEKEKEIP
jgi:hypothetical protein